MHQTFDKLCLIDHNNLDRFEYDHWDVDIYMNGEINQFQFFYFDD